MRNFSQSVDYELLATGVSMTCICPGPVLTNFGKAANCDDAIFLNTPGTALTPKESAKRALRVMFAGEKATYDCWFPFICNTLDIIIPQPLGATICAINQNSPSQALSIIKRGTSRPAESH